MKIFVVGIVASGKTTLSKRLSDHLKIPHYELDVIAHPVIDGKRLKRSDFEQVAKLKEIDKEGPWLFEGTMRKSSRVLLDMADIIVFLDPPLALRKRRILTRFIKQQLGIEKCHYKSNITMLKYMYKWTRDFEKDRKNFEKNLLPYEDKLLTLHARCTSDNFCDLIGHIKKQ